MSVTVIALPNPVLTVFPRLSTVRETVPRLNQTMTMITRQMTIPTIPAILAIAGFRERGCVETGLNIGLVAGVGVGSDIGQTRMLIGPR